MGVGEKQARQADVAREFQDRLTAQAKQDA